MGGAGGKVHDLLVVGGGVNGVGVARDAAGRGLATLLVEQDDLAAATSQWSTKLIHGGLRYLEHYEFRLVAESLAEREVLLAQAPHLIEPLSFVLPHEPHLRPAWMIRAGLFLYDRLGGRMTLPRSFGVRLDDKELGTRKRGAGSNQRNCCGSRSSSRANRGTCLASWCRAGGKRTRICLRYSVDVCLHADDSRQRV